MRIEGITHGHIPLPAVDFLISDGNTVLEDTGRAGCHELAGLLHEDVGCPPIDQPDRIRIGARCHDELVLELARGAGKDQVDAGPEIVVHDAAVSGKTGIPLRLIALEVAEHGSLPVLTAGLDGARALEFEGHGPALILAALLLHHGDGETTGCEVERLVVSLDVECRLIAVDLPLVLDEVEGEAAELLLHANLGGW